MDENEGTSGAVELSSIAVEMSTVAVDMSTNVVESQDFTCSFKTDTIFATREELLTWMRAVGKSLGMVIVIGRSDTGRRSGKQYCMLICDKAGSYKTNVEEGRNTRKCCCPFRLKGKFIKKLGGWILRVMDGTHNHGLATYHEGRPYIGRLTSEEKELVARMTRNHTRPKLILNELKLMKPDDNYTVVKQIYNCCQRQRSAMREGKTELQQLMFYLQRDNYVYWTRLAEGTAVVKDIFWAHPDSIELLNTFPVVLLIDSTYKTNRYRYPLVEIVGVTSTEKTYSAAFLGRGEEAWQSVRTDLMEELNQYNDFYTRLYGGIGKVTFLMKALLRAHHGPNIEDNWMTTPDMGYLISNKYKVVLTCWSPNCCYTIFPFNVAPFRSARQFNILLVPQHKHFVQVFMKLGSPMPVPDLIWNTNRAPIAKGWDSLFTGRMQRWKNLIIKSQPPHPLPCVDLSKDSDGSQC